MKTFFTSDTHYSHVRIPEFEPRRAANWPTLSYMNEGLIERWNKVVEVEDTVYHLGDFAMGDKTKSLPIGKRLNGHKILILGNHDAKPARMIAEAGFEEVYDELTIECTKKLKDSWTGHYKVRLRHYPLGKHNGDVPEEPGDFDYLFCGHVHSLWKNRGSEINVGVDVPDWDFTPQTFEQLTKDIPAREWPTIEWDKHHKTNELIR